LLHRRGSDALIGQTVSHRILTQLGGSGIGLIREAEDTHFGRFVILKSCEKT
jgi:hypothetical protein